VSQLKKILSINLALVFCNLVYAQDSNKLNIYIGLGGAMNTVNQDNYGFQNGGYATSLGLYSERQMTQHASFLCGLSLNYKWLNDYRNTKFDYAMQMNTNLSTSISQLLVEFPMLFAYNFHRFSVGCGIKFSYLLASNLNQKALGPFDSSGNILNRYNNIHNLTDNSLLTKINIAPILCIGFILTKKVKIILSSDYELISNPVWQNGFNSFNLINTSITLNYKFKN
jgi:hypothetical protein